MSTAKHALRNAQAGFETVAGTPVAATALLVGDIVIEEGTTDDEEQYPRGFLAPVSDDLVVARESRITFEGDATYEELLYPLQSGVLGVASPTGAGPYTWAFGRDLAQAEAIAPLTWEYVIADGAANHYARQVAYAVCRSFGLEIAFGQPTAMRAEWFGRASQTLGAPAAVSALAGRARIPASLWKVYIDDTWAGLGGTLASSLIRSAQLEVTTGKAPGQTIEGRADLDFTNLDEQMAGVSLSLTMEHTAEAAGEFQHWRDRDLRFVRLQADNGLAAGANKQVTVDLALRYRQPPQISHDENVEILTFQADGRIDTTSSEMDEFTVVNGLSARP